MKYDWILFDADETLFSFDAFKGLQTMFSRFGVDFSRQDYDEFQLVNKPLWDKYQNGEITAHQLQNQRFESWADRLATTTSELNRLFLDAMAEICQLLPGVQQMLDQIRGQAQLGIITNGFTQLQSVRLERTGLSDYFEHVFISEQLGVAKPDRAIFDHAISRMGEPSRSRVLMVGDNIHSDVAGGLNAGVDTCWLNLSGQARPEHIEPHYELNRWEDFHQVVG